MFTFVYSLCCTGSTLCDLLMLGVNQIDDGFPSITECQARFVPVIKVVCQSGNISPLKAFKRIQYIPLTAPSSLQML